MCGVYSSSFGLTKARKLSIGLFVEATVVSNASLDMSMNRICDGRVNT